MDATELASALNTLAILFVILISLRVHRKYPEPFFFHWVAAHLFEGLLMYLEVVANVVGDRPVGFALLEVGVIAAGVHHMIQTGRTLQGKPLGRRGAIAFFGALVAPSAVLAAMGHGHTTLVVWPLLAVMATSVWLGGVFMLDRRLNTFSNAMWLGMPHAAKGLVAMWYPFFVASGLLWLQNVIGVLIHLVTGVGMIMMLVDRTTDDLRRKNAELQELDTLKTNFLHTMSHELRTPLAVIGGVAELVRLDPDARDRYATMIEDKVHHLDALVNDILDFSRLETQTLPLVPEDEDLGAIALEVAASLRPLFEQRGQALETEVFPSLPVHCDRLRIVQVLTNLLDNARKFTPPGGLVTITARVEQAEAVVSVADTGAGIPPEHHARIFEKFHQVDGSSTREYGGLGLGLAICKHLVERHGGRIAVESAVGQGATFTVFLPLAPVAPAPMETPVLAHAR